MAKRPTLTDLTSQYGAQSVVNTNNANIEAAFDNTLSRDGSSPNQMGADIDLNSNSLLNVSQTHTSSLFVGGQLFLPSTATTLLTWLGAWVTATNYDPYDVVSRNGSSYLCLVAHTSDNFTTDLSGGKWVLLAQAGSAGAGSGDLLAANNLSDVDNASSSLSNLGGQPFSATLTTLSSATAAGLALMDDVDASEQRSTLGLGAGSLLGVSADTDFSNDPADLATRGTIKTLVDNAVAGFPFTSSFESLNIAWTTNDYIDLGAHGLGGVPTLIRVWANCKVANSGYSIGDIIDLSAGQWNAGSNAYGVQAMASSTNLYLRVGASGILYLAKSTSSSNLNMSASLWDLNVRAYA